ncbi:Transposase [Bacteroidales bacterium Barb6]|nr:Transposase [Bacteroidales bacterium Barb6]
MQKGEVSEILVCAEYTGQYIWPLCYACKDLSIDLRLENPAQIKHNSGVQRGKNDRSDARRIAAYAFRFQDKARLYNLPQENITSLQQLTSERDMYVTDKSRYQGQLTFLLPVGQQYPIAKQGLATGGQEHQSPFTHGSSGRRHKVQGGTARLL